MTPRIGAGKPWTRRPLPDRSGTPFCMAYRLNTTGVIRQARDD